MAVNNDTNFPASLSFDNLGPPYSRQWGHTQVKIVETSYLWTISNFSYCPLELGKKLESPIFTTDANDEQKWCLRMYPKGNHGGDKDHLSVFLALLKSKEFAFKVKYVFSIIDKNMKKTNSSEGGLNKSEVVSESMSCGFGQFISRDTLMSKRSDLLPDDKLTICCDISIPVEVINVSDKNNEMLLRKIPKRLALDLGVLLEAEKFSDVTLAVGGREFRAHKAMLVARSSVFSAMFEHDMTELKTNRVEISEMDADVFEEMLRFIYTGETKNLDKMADGLLAAADKYDLERLKALSEEVICNNLAVENAADCLMLADLHCADRLTVKSIHFIIRHVAEVMQTTGFKSMMATQPLVAELFRTSALRTIAKSTNCLELNK